jgi:hypothetical protein
VKEFVSCAGVLRGADREATCTVRATKVSMPSAPNEFRYGHISIENVSEKLPAGTYALLCAFGGPSLWRPENGGWVEAA